MKRLILLCALLVGVVLFAPTASAQTYGGGGGGTPPPPEAPPSGCPVEDPPPADPPPCHPRERATVTPSSAAPGDTVTVSTPPLYIPNRQVTINVVRAHRGATPVLSEPTTPNSEGAVSDTFVVPDVDPGIYYVYVVGQDEDGNRIVAIATLVIRPGSQAASVGSDSFQTAAAAPVPAAVAEVQTDLPADTEAAIVDAVIAGDAGVVLSPEGTLDVRTPGGTTRAASALPTTGNDISGPVTAGAALILAGTGLVLMRRRKEVRS